MNNFDAAFAKIIGVEGGYTNDPLDLGGETKFGISKRAHPDVDIKNLTIEAAKAIYLKDYWLKLGCDGLPAPLDLFVFDAGVNQGVQAAATMLQSAVGAMTDGVIGQKTIDKVNKLGPRAAVLFMANRAMRYAGSREPQRSEYLHGWMNRLFSVALGES